MPSADALRWDSRYLGDDKEGLSHPRSLLVDHVSLLPTRGLGLDIAMGLGANAGVLLHNGLRVVGVDISSVAVSRAKKNYPHLMAVIADLEHFYLPPYQFDVILDFFYLQRNLWQSIRRGLKPGGLLFIECLTDQMLSTHPDIDPKYLLKSGELRSAFTQSSEGENFEILHYTEGWSTPSSAHQRATASLIARRVG